MSHVWCIECRGNEHVCAFGLGGGGYGSYTMCECGVVLESVPLTDEDERVAVRLRIPHGLECVGGQDGQADAASDHPGA